MIVSNPFDQEKNIVQNLICFYFNWKIMIQLTINGEVFLFVWHAAIGQPFRYWNFNKNLHQYIITIITILKMSTLKNIHNISGIFKNLKLQGIVTKLLKLQANFDIIKIKFSNPKGSISPSHEMIKLMALLLLEILKWIAG